MTALDSIVNSFTGPGCLRAALRQKTAPIRRLLASLDGPTELRVSIPASVFGGDIFGVMSQHLREALVCPPPPAPAPRAAHRKHVLRSVENPSFLNPSNPFPLLDSRLRGSTPKSSPIPEARTSRPRDFTDLQQNRISQIEEIAQATETATEKQAAQENRILQQQQLQPDYFQQETRTRTLPPLPALVSSLQRYWESSPEKRQTAHTQPQPSVAEVLASGASFPVAKSDQRTAPRPWPTPGGSDISEKLRAFSPVSHSALKPNRLNATLDGQVQNIFNIEVKNANQYAPDYDDLGERIAQILHEQALQHGIDIT